MATTSLRPFLLAVVGVLLFFPSGSSAAPFSLGSRAARTVSPVRSSDGTRASSEDEPWSDVMELRRAGGMEPRRGWGGEHHPAEENDLYATLLTVQQQFGFELHVPQLVLLGAQSAGKTTFIQSIIGWKVGFTRSGTATRCPVVYELKNNSGKRDRIKVSVGTSADALTVLPGGPAGLPVFMQGHMERLEAENRFSHEPLWVRTENFCVWG